MAGATARRVRFGKVGLRGSVQALPSCLACNAELAYHNITVSDVRTWKGGRDVVGVTAFCRKAALAEGEIDLGRR